MPRPRPISGSSVSRIFGTILCIDIGALEICLLPRGMVEIELPWILKQPRLYLCFSAFVERIGIFSVSSRPEERFF